MRLVHLLEHTAGFDDIGLREYAHNEPDPVTLRDGLAYHPRSRICRWRPGRHYSYANSGPAVAAYVVEKIAGRPYEDFVQERIFAPVGMTTATFFEPPDDLLAKGYESDGATEGYYWHILMRPSGAVNASSREMAAFVRLLLNRGSLDGLRLVEPASIDRMEVPASTLAASHGLTTGYGLNNYTSQRGGFVWHGHGGGVNTFISDYAYNKEHGLGFFVALNSIRGDAFREIQNLLRDYLTRGLEPAPDPETALAPEALRVFTGYYREMTPRAELARFLTRLLGIVEITLRDGKLGSRPVLGGEVETLVPVGDRLFRGEEEARATAVFLEGDDGGRWVQGTGVAIQGNFRRVSALAVWGQLALAVLALAAMASAVVFALVWVPRKLFGRLSRVEHLSARVLPLLAVLAFAAVTALLMGAASDAVPRLGRPTFWSIGFWLGSWLFGLLSVIALVQTWRLRQGLRRGIFVHSLLVSLASVVVAAYLAYWGILGMRTWV